MSRVTHNVKTMRGCNLEGRLFDGRFLPKDRLSMLLDFPADKFRTSELKDFFEAKLLTSNVSLLNLASQADSLVKSLRLLPKGDREQVVDSLLLISEQAAVSAAESIAGISPLIPKLVEKLKLEPTISLYHRQKSVLLHSAFQAAATVDRFRGKFQLSEALAPIISFYKDLPKLSSTSPNCSLLPDKFRELRYLSLKIEWGLRVHLSAYEPELALNLRHKNILPFDSFELRDNEKGELAVLSIRALLRAANFKEAQAHLEYYNEYFAANPQALREIRLFSKKAKNTAAKAALKAGVTPVLKNEKLKDLSCTTGAMGGAVKGLQAGLRTNSLIGIVGSTALGAAGGCFLSAMATTPLIGIFNASSRVRNSVEGGRSKLSDLSDEEFKFYRADMESSFLGLALWSSFFSYSTTNRAFNDMKSVTYTRGRNGYYVTGEGAWNYSSLNRPILPGSLLKTLDNVTKFPANSSRPNFTIHPLPEYLFVAWGLGVSTPDIRQSIIGLGDQVVALRGKNDEEVLKLGIGSVLSRRGNYPREGLDLPTLEDSNGMLRAGKIMVQINHRRLPVIVDWHYQPRVTVFSEKHQPDAKQMSEIERLHQKATGEMGLVQIDDGVPYWQQYGFDSQGKIHLVDEKVYGNPNNFQRADYTRTTWQLIKVELDKGDNLAGLKLLIARAQYLDVQVTALWGDLIVRRIFDLDLNTKKLGVRNEKVISDLADRETSLVLDGPYLITNFLASLYVLASSAKRLFGNTGRPVDLSLIRGTDRSSKAKFDREVLDLVPHPFLTEQND